VAAEGFRIVSGRRLSRKNQSRLLWSTSIEIQTPGETAIPLLASGASRSDNDALVYHIKGTGTGGASVLGVVRILRTREG
jgi:hypothetical protein